MSTSLAPVQLELTQAAPKPVRATRDHHFLECLFDVLAVIAAWQLTLGVRVLLNPFMSLHLTRATLANIAPPLWGVVLLWIIAALWLNVYRHTSDELSRGASLLRLLESVIVFGSVTIVVTFFSRSVGADLSRSFVLLFLPVCLVTLTVARYLCAFAALTVEKQWPSERIAVVAPERHGQAVMERIRHFGGGSLAGLIVPATTAEESSAGGTVLGTTPRLAELINSASIDRIIILEQELSEAELQHCVSVSKRMGVIVTRIIGLPERDARPQISERYGLRLLELKPVAFTRGQELLKRSFDIAASLGLLLLLAPLLLLIAVLVKSSSKGSILYRSTRAGKGGRHFQFLKFRTMYSGNESRKGLEAKNEKGGHIFKIKNDPRVTPVGRILRRWSLDELPQLVNVLLGDMSMVGPRPLPANDLDPDGQSKDFQSWAEQRSRVLPGITGLWQIRGRSELPFEKMVEYDVEYIRDWSLALDLRILLETPIVLITGRGAY